MVVREGLRLVLIGMAVGLLASFWLTRFLQSQLFEVTPSDPLHLRKYAMMNVVNLPHILRKRNALVNAVARLA